MYRV
jgi:phage N-6-adenine-methyltransferase